MTNTYTQTRGVSGWEANRSSGNGRREATEYTFASRHSSFEMTNSSETWIDTQSGTPGKHHYDLGRADVPLKPAAFEIPKPITSHSMRHAFEFLACLMRREELQLVGVEGLLRLS